jgi:large conductance mechanosensitive channel
MAVRNLWQEFKTFAMKGNMIDLAVAVVIGTAFGAIVTSLVNDILMPTVSYVLPAGMSYEKWAFGNPAKPILIGKFLAAIVNFVIVALSVFVVIVKIMGGMMKRAAGTPKPSEPTTKECPRCLSMIPLRATRCAHCTSDLPTDPAAA